MHDEQAGQRIKTMRETREVPLSELSARSGLSPEKILAIENGEGKISPSLLIRIARGLAIRPGLLLDDQEILGPVIMRTTTTSDSTAPHRRGRPSYLPMAIDKAGRHMEPFLISFSGGEQTKAELSSHGGEEFLYVLEGRIKVDYGTNSYIIETGESIYYDSVTGHRVCAADNSGARLLAVLYTPY